MTKKNYVCIIQLLNFKQLCLESGKDLLKIRVDNILNQVRKILGAISQIRVEISEDKIKFEMGEDNAQFEKFIELMMDYTKQSLLFGLPHRAIIFKEESINFKEDNLNLNLSKERFLAIEKLENLQLACTILDKDLYEEKSEVFSKYAVVYNNELVLKLSKRPIADIALQGIKNSINNSFNKIGINDLSLQYSTILNNTLKFVDVQNV